MKFIVALVLVAIGIISLSKSFQVARLFGKSELAEKYLGPGGTYVMWKIIGVGVIVAAMLVIRYPAAFGLASSQPAEETVPTTTQPIVE